jgi:DNA helicase HerA-like ATPase
MAQLQQFSKDIKEGYTFSGESVLLGSAMLNHEPVTGLQVNAPLKMFNRHGLIAGATGTGKTKTLQVIAEQLSEKGVPSLLMDIKGDLSGIAASGEKNAKIEERHAKIGIEYQPAANPVELLTISSEKGSRIRSTVLEFGPVLFSKILGLNETQAGMISLIFKYCDDNHLPLLDLKDVKRVLQYLGDEGKEKLTQTYGTLSSSSVGTIMRKIIELEQQGAETFFGEPSFDVDDLCRTDHNGKGIISILRLTDIQDKPKLFSTVMLQMLAEIYSTFPEEGDLQKPKLCLFIDEAHLVFEEATSSLLDQIEAIIKLIRSKGVGIFFITQNPADIPEAVLGQLGMKIQHGLRAFTAKDRKTIKLAAENYPGSVFYNTAEMLTELGIGECFFTGLNENGIPTPLVHTYLRAPQSRMDVLTAQEIDQIVSTSELVSKYNTEIDRESAYEILNDKILEAEDDEHQLEMEKQREKLRKSIPQRQEKSTFEKVMGSPATRQIGSTIAREMVRGLMGVMGVKFPSGRGRGGLFR